MAHDRSREGRELLAGAVSDLFAEEDAVLSPRERDLMTDILNRLVKDVEISVRRKLSQRLADVESAPHALMVELANDEIEIAAPVLSRSKVLRDIDLIEIVRHRTMEHQLGVAMRDTLGASVSKALVETDNAAVVETLLRNQEAHIEPETMSIIVHQSRDRRNYQEPLLHRKELSPDLAKRMYGWVSAALRTAILDRYDLDENDFDDAMEIAVRESFNEAEIGDNNELELSLESLLTIDEVAQSELVQALREGEVTQFQMLLQKATGLRLPFLRVLMFEKGGERLAIACRAIDMASKVFAAIYRLLSMTSRQKAQMPRGDLTRIASLYLDIKPELAVTVLHHWRDDPEFHAEIEQVTGKTPL
jgi:uncharacterized protein (DUF2336 family)